MSQAEEMKNPMGLYLTLNEVQPSKDIMSILSISSSNSKNYTAVQKNVVEDSPIIQLPSIVECDHLFAHPSNIVSRSKEQRNMMILTKLWAG